MSKSSQSDFKPIEIHFNSMWSLPTVPDFPTTGKSCCEVIRTPSLREIINTYAETGQVIVHTSLFPDEIEGDSSKLGDYDIVDAWHDAQHLERVRIEKIRQMKEKSFGTTPESSPESNPTV